ncbi:Uncharacterised protein [Mycobacteroides abscessus subsp. abscessus]|nr:Uncharacterised protein [Mycobacteroides abscessus subsp. abscessus]
MYEGVYEYLGFAYIVFQLFFERGYDVFYFDFFD